MKLNPKLSSFVRDRKPANAEHPYILWEESDCANIQSLIESCASPSTKEYLKKNNQSFFDHQQHLDPQTQPFTYFRSFILFDLMKGKRDSGRDKVWEKVEQFFPNYAQLELANQLQKSVSLIRTTDTHIKEISEELFSQEEN